MEPLFHDLALILVVAAFTTVVFRYLRQPLVLGYILAGFLTGPYFEYVPTVTETSSLEFWGQVGVIFLLFGLGLEFNIKKLFKVGGAGFITVLSEVLIMFTVGYSLGRLFGWTFTPSVFLGGMICVSSTSIVIKAFDDLDLKSKKFSQLVMGVLVVEDIVAVLLLVILSAFGSSSRIDGPGMVSKMMYLGMFMLLWFTGGIYVLPSLFRRIRNGITDEILTVLSIGLCLAMVVVAEKSGFSASLGAFMMGSILSGTVSSDRIIRLIRPLKDFFGAIFFVTVGMLVDPSAIVDNWVLVLVLSASVLVFKSLAATLGLILSGQTIRTSVQAGMCLCQIGEFSFIIATLGRSLNVIPDNVYPVIVSVSIVTTFLTPYMIRSADPLYRALYNAVPSSWKLLMDRLGTGHRIYNRRSDWNVLLRKYLTIVGIYSGWIVFVTLLFKAYVNPYLAGLLEGWEYQNVLFFVITVFSVSPFIYGLLRKRSYDSLYEKIWNDSKYSRGPLLSMSIFKYVISTLFISNIVGLYLTNKVAIVLFVSVSVIVVFYYSKRLKNYYAGLESGFLENYHFDSRKASITMPRELAEEMHTDLVEVGVASPISGMTIQDIHRRYDTGAYVLRIQRGTSYIYLPRKEELVLPGDMLLLLGEDRQIMRFKDLSGTVRGQESDPEDIELFHITLSGTSGVVGSDANMTKFMEKYGLMLVAVEKQGTENLVKPKSSVIFEPGDTLWVAGDKAHVKSLLD